ncbi:glycoside hydrolase domain-containing protein [Kribbella sp. NPDC056951]|uniref:glycoside hydrolase domain-containing protein n=1 Tax=Kribbella sp. NPDC056951 TaxID=3345978 RepID=UPI00363999C7
MRLFRCFLALITLIALAPLTQARATGSLAGSWAWTESVYTSVFPDSRPSADSGDVLRLDTARNEYEAAQLVVRRPDAFRVDQVAFTDLVSGANRLPAANLEYKFVETTYLNRNSGTPNPVYPLTRTGAGQYPDGLSNDPARDVPARTTQPIWIRVFVPATTPGGLYTGTATVRTTAGDQAVPIQVDVRAVTLPEASDGGFTNALWSLMFGALDTGDPELGGREPVEDAFGQVKYTDGWWALMENLAKEWKAHRTNNLSVPMMRVLTDAHTSFDAATGKYVFQWQRFDEIVEFFLARGGVKRIEGFLQSYDHGNPDWSVEMIDPVTNTPVRRAWNSPTATRWLDQYTTALRAHLEAKGWASKFWTHVGDEPTGKNGESSWTGIANRMRAAWPDIKLGDAAYEEPAASRLAERADIMIPNLGNYSTTPAAYDRLRTEQGKELWLYNCSIPVANYLNRFVDQPQWHQRQTMWFAYSRGASGYLHWAMDKWWYPVDQHNEKGDGYIVLPDRARQTIKSTVRYESLRDGIEDWEVLNLLGKTDPVAARDLAAGLVPLGDKYTPDTSYMIRIRRTMLDLAAGRPVPALPATTTSGSGWRQLDFGKQVQLDTVRLRWTGGVPASVKLSISYDGSRWTPISASTGVSTPNAKARYVRIETASALSSVDVTGAVLASPNLAGGREYRWSETPWGERPDSGGEATDGVLADAQDDGRSVGFTFAPGARRTVSLTMDLGTVQRVGRARTHAYEEYPAYRPDEVRVLTSVDGERFTSRAAQPAPRGTAGVWYDLTFAAAPARYVRFEFPKTGSATGDKMFVDDVEVYGASEPANLAWGRPVYRNVEPAAAYPDSGQESTDGIRGGGFGDGLGYGYPLAAGETKSVEVEVDLGGSKVVDRVRVAAYDDDLHDYAPDKVQVVVAGAVVAEAVVPVGGWYDLSFPAVSHDGVVVRLTKTEHHFADYLFVDEIVVQGAIGPDLVRSYSAPAAQYPDGGSESADGVLAGHYRDGRSYGYPAPRTADVVLDLGSVAPVSLVRVRAYADGEHDYAPSEVVVATSTDGTSYTERTRTSTAAARWFELPFSAVDARYVRVTLRKTTGTNADWLFIDELTAH